MDENILDALTKLTVSGEKATDANDQADSSKLVRNLADGFDASDYTDRELDIIKAVAEGLSNKQIAEKLYISEGTVKNYISAIYDKTGIHDRVKLVVALKG